MSSTLAVAAFVHRAFWLALLLVGAGCGIDNRTLKLIAFDSGTDGTDVNTGGINGCTPANTQVAPADGVIATFVGNDVFLEFASPESALVNYAATNGALYLSVNQAKEPNQEYEGVILSFPTCIDASAFDGVEFTIAGSVSGCTMQYSTEFSEDYSSARLGSCTDSMCYSPQSSVLPTSTATILEFPWNASSYATGSPIPSPQDAAKIVGIQWQFTVPPSPDGGSAFCVADATITDLHFYRSSP